MKIQSINSIANNLHYHDENVINQHKQMPFHARINGSEYAEDIIKLAKENLNNPEWKKQLRREKLTAGEAVKNWHERVDWANDSEFDKANRIITGILSLGVTEVIMDANALIHSAADNIKIEHKINEVAKCMDDLRHSKQSY